MLARRCDKFIFTEFTLHLFFENKTVFYLRLLASQLEKVFVWIVNSNKPTILLIASP